MPRKRRIFHHFLCVDVEARDTVRESETSSSKFCVAERVARKDRVRRDFHGLRWGRGLLVEERR
jgi:hypothetical protein